MAEVKKPTTAIRGEILANPNVVLGDPELMSALLAADSALGAGRNIVDLRGKLVERLEGRLDQLEETNRTVIAAAYENLAGTNQVHRATLALLEPQDFRGFLTVLGDEVAHILSIDAIRLGLETTNAAPGTPLGPKGNMATLVTALPIGGVDAYLSESPGRPTKLVSLRRATAQSDELYGAGQAFVQSEAVLKLDLGRGKRPGLLAMGSEDPARFSPDQGTDLLTFFGGCFERMLRRWLA